MCIKIHVLTCKAVFKEIKSNISQTFTQYPLPPFNVVQLQETKRKRTIKVKKAQKNN